MDKSNADKLIEQIKKSTDETAHNKELSLKTTFYFIHLTILFYACL